VGLSECEASSEMEDREGNMQTIDGGDMDGETKGVSMQERCMCVSCGCVRMGRDTERVSICMHA
jgi:hypothetical protein